MSGEPIAIVESVKNALSKVDPQSTYSYPGPTGVVVGAVTPGISGFGVPGSSVSGVWTGLQGKPFYTLSTEGIANGLSTITNNGADFGPDTPGTITGGLNEAVNALPQAAGLAEQGGGIIVILKSRSNVTARVNMTGQVVIPNTYPFSLTIRGLSPQTEIRYVGTTVQPMIVTAVTNSAPGTNTLNINCENVMFVQDGTMATDSVVLGATNSMYFRRVDFVTLQALQGTNGYTLDYGNVPSSAAALTHIKLPNQQNNQMIFKSCRFVGGAIGIHSGTDHLRVEDCDFANISVWNNAGTTTIGNARATGSYLSPGAGIVIDPALAGVTGLLDQSIVDCHWFQVSVCVIDNNGQGTYPGQWNLNIGGFAETVGYFVLTVKNNPFYIDGVSMTKGGAAPFTTLTPVASISSTGVISTTYSTWNSVVFKNTRTNSNNPVMPPQNATGNISALSLTSGTSALSPYLFDAIVYIPITFNPTSTAAATVKIQTGLTAPGATIVDDSEPAGLVTGRVRTYTILLKAGHYITVTVTNATIGTIGTDRIS